MVGRKCISLLLFSTMLLASGCTSTNRSAFNLNLPQTPGNRVDPGAVTDCLLNRWNSGSNEPGTGWIWPDHALKNDPISYSPREGDIVIFTSRSPIYVLVYSLGGTGHPFHIGLIVRRSDGTLAILESGAVGGEKVKLSPVGPRLKQYRCEKKDALFWVRPICFSLTAQQSRCLTSFAEAQVGKEFGTARAARFALPGEPKTKSTSNQETWFCSELTAQALKHAGMIRGVPRPAAILPDDFYHNRDIDLNFGWQPSLAWTMTDERPNRRPLLAPLRPE